MEGTILFLVALVLSIALGVIFKVNVGVFGFISAMLIGCVYLGLPMADIYALWPNKLFFTMLFVTFLFGFAVCNGALDALAMHVTWKLRKAPALIPFVLFLIVFGLAASGMSTYAIYACVGPLVVTIAAKLNMKRIMAACIVQGGGSIGGFSPISQLGATMLNTFGVLGYTADEGSGMLKTVFINNIIAELGLFVICYLIFRAYKIKVRDDLKPEPFTKEQKKTLLVYAGCLVLIVGISLTHAILPDNVLFTGLFNLDITTIALLGVVVCTLLKVADMGKALSKVPLSAIVMICSVSLLIAVGVKAGAVEVLSQWAASSINGMLAPYFIILVSGIMSLFASAVSVVVPTIGTMIPGLAKMFGFAPGYLFSLSTSMAIFSGYSPFSSGGGITLSGVFDEKERDVLFKWSLIIPVMGLAYMCVVTLLNLWVK